MATAKELQFCEKCARVTKGEILCESCATQATFNAANYVFGRLNSGVPEQEIVDELVAERMPEGDARRLVRSVAADMAETATGKRPASDRGRSVSRGKSAPNADARAAAANDFLWGAIWLFGGIAVTVGTYAMADPGGAYIVSYGPAVYGVYRLIRGIARYMSA